MPDSEFETRSFEETIAKGRDLGATLKPPVLILLTGDLGAGKTTLTKGIASGFGAAPEEEITSPTFTLVHRYGGGPAPVYHIDLYRIGDARDFDTLGLEDLFLRKRRRHRRMARPHETPHGLARHPHPTRSRIGRSPKNLHHARNGRVVAFAKIMSGIVLQGFCGVSSGTFGFSITDCVPTENNLKSEYSCAMIVRLLPKSEYVAVFFGSHNVTFWLLNWTGA